MMSVSICSAQKIRQQQFFLSNGAVDVQGGVSVPLGDFGLSKLTLPAGYALTGYNIKLGINYDITPYLGLAIQYQYIQNPFNNSKILEDIRQKSTNITYNSYSSDPWKLQGMLMGLYYPMRAHKTTIDLRLMGALITGVLPGTDEDINVPSQNNQHYHFKQLENSASGIGVQAGVKIRYQLYKKLILSMSADYTHVNIQFEDVKIIETIRNIRIAADDYSQKFQVLNFSAGIGIQFD
jgi:hypothetical protein